MSEEESYFRCPRCDHRITWMAHRLASQDLACPNCGGITLRDYKRVFEGDLDLKRLAQQLNTLTKETAAAWDNVKLPPKEDPLCVCGHRSSRHVMDAKDSPTTWVCADCAELMDFNKYRHEFSDAKTAEADNSEWKSENPDSIAY